MTAVETALITGAELTGPALPSRCALAWVIQRAHEYALWIACRTPAAS
jgi:hypothetical protein